MPNYNFKQDFPIAQKTEREVADEMVKRYGFEVISFCNNSDYDILLKKDDRAILVEVKEDFTCAKTGNVGVEFSCRGKPSGIEVSKATHYIYKIHTRNGIVFVGVKVNELKRAIQRIEYHRIVNGGDEGSNSMNYLFHYEDFVKLGDVLFSEK